MAVLATWAPEDAILAAVAPLALAAAAGTCLVVDLDMSGPRYPGTTSLAAMVADGPRAVDLSPARRGVAVLANGGVPADAAAGVVDALIDGWPNVVLRLPPTPTRPSRAGVVPVVLEPSGFVGPKVSGARVVQPTGVGRRRQRAPGVVRLPVVRRSTVSALLSGRVPGSSRWLRGWRQVWTLSWR